MASSPSQPHRLVSALTIAWVLAWGGRATAHDFHSSLAEVTWRDGRLEVSLRLFPDDLERALTTGEGERAVLDGRPETQTLVLAYIQRHFQFGAADAEPVTWSWVGEEVGPKVFWVHLEAELPQGLAGAWCWSTLLFELFDDQVNLVNVRGPEGRHAVSFVPGSQRLVLPHLARGQTGGGTETSP